VLAGGLTVVGKDSKGAEAAVAGIGGDGTVKTAVLARKLAHAKTGALARDSTGSTSGLSRDAEPRTNMHRRSP
jgi:hypothetical protein